MNYENQSGELNLNFQKELLYFKDDILKDLKSFESKLSSKYNDIQQSVETKLKYYDEKIEVLTEKMSNVSITSNQNKTLEEKIENINKFKDQIKDQVLTNEIKLDSTYKDLQNAIFKYDKMFSETVIYPGVIGNSCKYKTFHAFIDYLIIQIAQLNTFKEKNILDLKSYKSKLDNLISSFKLQIDNITNTMTEFTTKSVNDCEDRIKNILKIYDDKLQDMRIENNKYLVVIKDEFIKIKEEWEKVLQIKKDIYYRFDNEVSNMKESYNNVSLKFEGYKKEFNLIKNRFTQLSEFIKDVRFRVNLGNGITKRDALNLSNKIDFTKKQVYIDPHESYMNLVKNAKKSNYINKFIKNISRADSGLILTGQKRKSVINPIVQNSFEKPIENYYKTLKKQKSVGADLVKNFIFSNKIHSNNSFNKLNLSVTPKNFEEDNENKIKIIENKSDSEKSDKKLENIFKKIETKKISIINNNSINNNINNKVIDNNNNKNEHIVNISLGGELNLKNYENIRKKKKYKSKEGRINMKFTNSIDDNSNKKLNISDKIDEESSLIQNKSYSIFPKIQNKSKEELTNENDKNTNNPIIILSKTTRNNKNDKNILNQKSNTSNQLIYENSNINKIKGKEIVTSFENKIQKIKNKQNPYKHNLDSNIKNNSDNLYYNKYDSNSDNLLINKKQNNMKNDYSLNNNKANINKTQNFSKNQNILNYSQDKGVSDNYYYNLMINEDLNATNTGLKSLPKTHYGSMKRK